MHFYAEIKGEKKEFEMENVWIDEEYGIETFEGTVLIRGMVIRLDEKENIFEKIKNHPRIVKVQFDQFGMMNENWKEGEEIPSRKLFEEDSFEDVMEYLSYHESEGSDIEKYEKWIKREEKKIPLPIVRKMIKEMGQKYRDKRSPYQNKDIFLVEIKEAEESKIQELYLLGYEKVYQPQIKQEVFVLMKENGEIEEIKNMKVVKYARKEEEIKLGKRYR